MPNQLGIAVVMGCSDPRLAAAAAAMNLQIMEKLGVAGIIPFTSPGVVGLYSDRSVLNLPLRLADFRQRRSFVMDDCRRIALEEGIVRHLKIHNPTDLVVTSHHDCKGHPGDDDQQERDAIVAAEVLGKRMQQRGFLGPVHAAMQKLYPNPGWKIKFLR